MVTKQAEVAATEVTRGIVGKIGLPVIVGILGLWFVWTNWDSIQTASRKLDAVDGNSERSKDNYTAINEIKLKLIDLEDFKGDSTERLNRVETRAVENTDQHKQQQRRATTRIAEQGFREQRLKVLEAEFKRFREEFMETKIKQLESRIRELEKN